MLRRLAINDFALIDKLSLEFEPGLNLFTGETGAGKTIILNALELILGGRARGEMIRSDCEQAYVEAFFEVSGNPRVDLCLTDHGLVPDPDGLLIAREVSRAGKNRCFVNGRQTVLSCLKELGDLLVDLHGQHEHQRLLSTAHHSEILDAFGDAEFQAFRAAAVQKIERLREAQRRLSELDRAERERALELDTLQFQTSELDEAAVRAGEDVELERDWRLLARAEEIRRDFDQLDQALSGDEGPQVLRLLARFRAQLAEVAAARPALAETAGNLDEAYFLLESVRDGVTTFLMDFATRPERLAEIEERLTALNKLKRKYGPTLDDVLAARRQFEARLAELRGDTTSREELAALESSLRGELQRELPELSRRRRRLADLLEKRVTADLADLAMRGAVFRVQLERETCPPPGDVVIQGTPCRLYRDGLERAEFFVSTNPGEPQLPLVKVASGGELSRVTLAIKSALAVLEAVPIMVFDEIDSGIGGETATNVAAKLLEVSRRCQCLCITHLPQIASRGQVHFAVRKRPRKDRTVVSVERLDGPSREAEIARMLGGKGDASLQLARRMLTTG
ncbi:MAG: DNA repair protein RecN [Candidatus Riflebacteria bacterium]|nr:DNA repair protein RecN [Candidatus Riflebacteria bacterium]